MTLQKKKTVSVSYIIRVIIAVALMFGFGLLPPIPGLEKLGMQILGIFLGLIFSWICIGFTWPSLLAVLALYTSGYTTIPAAIASGFGADLTIFVMLILIYTRFLFKTGLCDRLSYWILSRKFATRSPWLLITAIFIVAWLLSALSYVYPAIYLCWEIFYKISDDLGYEKKDKFVQTMVFGIGLAAMAGYVALPTKAIQIAIMGALSTVTEGAMAISFGHYILFMVPISLLCIAVWMVIMKFMPKPDDSKVAKIDKDYFATHRDEKFNKKEKIAFASVILLIILLCLPSVLPQGTTIYSFFNGLGMNGCLFIVLVLLLVGTYEGKPIMNFDEVANSGGMNWNVILMFAGLNPIIAAVKDESVGIVNLVTKTLNPVLEAMGPTAFIIFSLVITYVLTQFFANLTVSGVLCPIILTLGMSLGVNIYMLALLMCFTANWAMLTPAGSATMGTIFANERIDSKNGYFYGVLSFIFPGIVILPLSLLFGMILL